jgi:hypothetical protein
MTKADVGDNPRQHGMLLADKSKAAADMMPLISTCKVGSGSPF